MPFPTQAGFHGPFQTEARAGALPPRQNTPLSGPQGLYSEQINGTGFTVSRAHNRRTWMYRLRPAIADQPYFPVANGRLGVAPGTGVASPQVRRYPAQPLPREDESVDFVDGLRVYGSAGLPSTRAGLSIHLYAANSDMDRRAFASLDGDLVLVPEAGRLHVQTELGRLEAGPGQLLIIPRGIRFRVTLPDGTARGFIAEPYHGHPELPEHGLIGPNGLADPRHFKAPVADFEDVVAEHELLVKMGTKLWRSTLPHSPFDVVAWHGNHAPLVYDLADFNSFGSVNWDHPDPSILTVLTLPWDTMGRSVLDVAVFKGRWDPTEDNFRPPFFHRNSAIEFNMVIEGPSAGGWKKGTFSYTPYLTPHAVSPGSVRAARSDKKALDNEPYRIPDSSLWVQFESCFPIEIDPFYATAIPQDESFLDTFSGYPEPQEIPG